MDLQNSRVYQKSLDLLTEAIRWSRSMPAGHGWLADQIRRASGSIPLNIAEGLGRPSPGDRRRFFHIAIGSTYEVAACLEVGFRLGTLSEDRFRKLWDDCDHITRMLGKLLHGPGQCPTRPSGPGRS